MLFYINHILGLLLAIIHQVHYIYLVTASIAPQVVAVLFQNLDFHLSALDLFAFALLHKVFKRMA